MFCVVIVFLCITSIIKCEDIGYIELNGEKITKNYSYVYIENESLNITCTSTIRSAVINISTNAFETIIATDQIQVYDFAKTVYLYLKLDASYHRKYIECEVSKAYGFHNSLTRINLIYNYTNTDFGHRVTIDGLPAPLRKCPYTSNGQELCYEYKFYDNENVTIQKGNDKEMRCNTNDTFNKPDQISVVKNHAICHIENPTHEIKNLMMKFTKIERDYNPFIDSLSFAKILAIFTRNENTTTIIYELVDSETIYLLCTNYRSMVFLHFYRNDIKLNLTHLHHSLRPNIGINYTLQSSENNATIRCVIPANALNNNTTTSTEVILIRRKVFKPDITTISSNNIYVETKTNIITPGTKRIGGTTEILLKDEEESPSSSKAIIIGGSIGAVVFVIIIGVITFKMIMKKSPPAKTDKTEMYAVPIPKSQRTNEGNNNLAYTSTDEHTNSQEMANNSQIKNGAFSYTELEFKPVINQHKWSKAIPYTEVKHESPYAEPSCSESPYAEPSCSESPYAEPRCSPSPYAEPNCNESPYSESMCSENPYAELKSNENPFPQQPPRYANVFTQSKYANFNQNISTGKDHVEPAYCEIMKNDL